MNANELDHVTHICFSKGFLTAASRDLFGAVPCQLVYFPLALSAGFMKLDLYSVVAGLTGIFSLVANVCVTWKYTLE